MTKALGPVKDTLKNLNIESRLSPDLLAPAIASLAKLKKLGFYVTEASTHGYYAKTRGLHLDMLFHELRRLPNLVGLFLRTSGRLVEATKQVLADEIQRGCQLLQHLKAIHIDIDFAQYIFEHNSAEFIKSLSKDLKRLGTLPYLGAGDWRDLLDAQFGPTKLESLGSFMPFHQDLRSLTVQGFIPFIETKCPLLKELSIHSFSNNLQEMVSFCQVLKPLKDHRNLKRLRMFCYSNDLNSDQHAGDLTPELQQVLGDGIDVEFHFVE